MFLAIKSSIYMRIITTMMISDSYYNTRNEGAQSERAPIFEERERERAPFLSEERKQERRSFF